MTTSVNGTWMVACFCAGPHAHSKKRRQDHVISQDGMRKGRDESGFLWLWTEKNGKADCSWSPVGGSFWRDERKLYAADALSWALEMGLRWGGSIFVDGATAPRPGALGTSMGWPLSLPTGLLIANAIGLMMGGMERRAETCSKVDVFRYLDITCGYWCA